MNKGMQQKLTNLENALATLERFLKITEPDEVQRAGIIQAFEFTL